jgi:predicted enzyme related to lactoylglutathione lyase
MTDLPPRRFGVTKDAMPVFCKVFVHDLPAMADFYEEVFGLVRIFEHSDDMMGRMISEISFGAGYPGGTELTLIHYHDSTAPIAGESVVGFTTTDLTACVLRAKAAGGRVHEPIKRLDQFGITVAFIMDPEGHVNEVVELDQPMEAQR